MSSPDARPKAHPVQLPAGSLLGSHRDAGAYVDCFRVDHPHTLTLAEFVEAFTTTPLFRVERTLLGWLARRPSTAEDARALAQATSNRFAIWTVEARNGPQLVLAAGRTRSWYCVEELGEGAGTRLLFGSAVLPRPRDGRMGFGFHALLGFHRLYSRALLQAAARRLAAR